MDKELTLEEKGFIEEIWMHGHKCGVINQKNYPDAPIKERMEIAGKDLASHKDNWEKTLRSFIAGAGYGKGGEEISAKRLMEIRNELYDNMPSGEIKAWDLIQVIKTHLQKLDDFIDAIPSRPSIDIVKQLREANRFSAIDHMPWEHSGYDGWKEACDKLEELLKQNQSK